MIRDNLLGDPQNADEALIYARRCVAALIADGYTPEKADAEACMGYCGPGAAGYQIRRGKIMVPTAAAKTDPHWWFSFRELAASVDEPAQSQFAFA